MNHHNCKLTFQFNCHLVWKTNTSRILINSLHFLAFSSTRNEWTKIHSKLLPQIHLLNILCRKKSLLVIWWIFHIRVHNVKSEEKMKILSQSNSSLLYGIYGSPNQKNIAHTLVTVYIVTCQKTVLESAAFLHHTRPMIIFTW